MDMGSGDHLRDPIIKGSGRTIDSMGLDFSNIKPAHIKDSLKIS